MTEGYASKYQGYPVVVTNKAAFQQLVKNKQERYHRIYVISDDGNKAFFNGSCVGIWSLDWNCLLRTKEKISSWAYSGGDEEKVEVKSEPKAKIKVKEGPSLPSLEKLAAISKSAMEAQVAFSERLVNKIKARSK